MLGRGSGSGSLMPPLLLLLLWLQTLLLLPGVEATWTAYQEYLSGLDSSSSSSSSSPEQQQRHEITFSPNSPWKSIAAVTTAGQRNQTCVVESHGDFVTDDSPAIVDAVKKCNPGGKVVFPEGKTYVVGKAMDLTGLRGMDIDIQGYIQFSNDTDYWQANAYKQIFQNATTFFQLGGADVNVYGGGMLDGNGQIWYDLYAKDKLILRPILFGTVGLHSGSISDLRFRYSPQYYNWVANSTDVVFDGINVSGYSQSEHEAKNTDAWDTYRSSNIVIQNSVVNNGDDCVSFKPNSTEILVQNLYCNGSHGISVGSLGQYPGEVDIVQNVYVYNISMYNASDGARIKVWPGSPSALSEDLQGGGGSGLVSNITYKDMYIENVDYAVEITQCYGQKNLTLCHEFPSNLTISGIDISGIHGTTSKKRDPLSGYVVCSSSSVCSNISLSDIDVVAPSGVKNAFNCGNVDEAALVGINCTSAK